MIANILDENGNVVNQVVADAEWLDQKYPGRWEVVPVSTPAQETKRHITRLAFRNRFTQAELVTLEIAGLDDPSATTQVRQLAASIRVMQRQVSEASYIDLDREDTRSGVQQLEAAGLLAPGRALEILDAEIQPIEIPQ